MSGGIPGVSTRFSVNIENEQADTRWDSRTCLAKPNSQARTGTRKCFPVQLTVNRIGNLTRLICTLPYVMTTHTCIHIYCSVYAQLPPVIEAPLPSGCCEHASGNNFPRPLWLGGCATHATPCSVPGYPYFRMCFEKSTRNYLTSYLYSAAILASFFLFACLKGCFRLS